MSLTSDPAPLSDELRTLDEKINAFLPPRYQHCYSTVSPVSMGSSVLKYQVDGKVAWDKIWTSFCDLAMAGGPPHRGRLLEPVTDSDEPDSYDEVVAELIRAIDLVTGLKAVASAEFGWIAVTCKSPTEAAWLRIAILAENVSARCRNHILKLPAGPRFYVEKEIKNVVVALAKCYHYWDGHLTAAQQSLIADGMYNPAEPVDQSSDGYRIARQITESGMRFVVGQEPLSTDYVSWLGVECREVEQTVWLLRAMIVEQIPARREGTILYLPICVDRGVAHSVSDRFAAAWRLWLKYQTTLME